MPVIIGLIFLVLGVLSIVKPEVAWNVRTFIGRKVFGISYKASDRTYRWFRIVGVVYILIGLMFLYNQFNSNLADENKITPPFDGTISGEYVCLPHRDTSGPQTEECAFGIKLDNGDYYAIDYGESGDLSDFQTGKRATLTGHFTPIEVLSTNHWMKYNVEGIFSVN